jgi:hypothetical protein
MFRVYSGWKDKEINNHLRLLEEIIEKKKIVKEQEQEFIEKTGKCRKSFYLYKAFLNRKTDSIAKPKKDIKKNCCYFCYTKKRLLIHHINFIRSDNRLINLLKVCSSCHKKIHNLFNQYLSVIESVIKSESIAK